MSTTTFVEQAIIQSTEAFKFVLWPLFGFVVLIFGLATAALVYRWHRYGMKSKLIMSAEILYIVVSAVLLVIALVSLIFS